MGNNRPIKTSDFIKFLTAHKCKYVRTKASHDLWQCPRWCRKITFRSKDKEVPSVHLKTNLTTMGLDLRYLYYWLEKN